MSEIKVGEVYEERVQVEVVGVYPKDNAEGPRNEVHTYEVGTGARMHFTLESFKNRFKPVDFEDETTDSIPVGGLRSWDDVLFESCIPIMKEVDRINEICKSTRTKYTAKEFHEAELAALEVAVRIKLKAYRQWKEMEGDKV